jgi:hypothetical protein
MDIEGLRFARALGLKSTLVSFRTEEAAVAPPPPPPGDLIQAPPDRIVTPTGAQAAGQTDTLETAAAVGGVGRHVGAAAASLTGRRRTQLTAVALLLMAAWGSAATCWRRP